MARPRGAEESCITVLDRCLLLYSFNAGERARVPGNLPYFFFSGKGRIRGFCRWWRLAWKSTRVGACDGRVVDGVGPKAVQDFPSACDRARRPEHRRLHADRGSGCSDQGDAGFFRIERGRPAGFCSEVWDRGRPHQGDALFISKRETSTDPSDGSGIGWPHESTAEFFRIGRQPAGFLREVWDRNDRIHRAGFSTRTAEPRDSLARIEDRDARIRALQNSTSSAAGPPAPARVQFAPLPQGVGSLLGRAGEARSGFCREVKP